MLSDRHDRRMLKLGEMLEDRKTQLEDHNAGRRRLSGEVRRKRGHTLLRIVQILIFVLSGPRARSSPGYQL
jgi:hypothetical protein